jgi:glycosyltransferase involved in cell wall biosynthesis
VRRVLLLTYHFPPSAASGSFRLLGFAQHLPQFGWDTLVVAPPALPWEPVDESLNQRVPSGTVVHRVPYPSRLPKAVRWLAPQAVWLPYARAATRQVIRAFSPNAVLTSGPPHWIHLLGRDARQEFGLPWIADFRDPWITAAFQLQLSSWQKRWQKLWERRVLAQADLVLANTRRAGEALQAACPALAGKIHWLTNGFDPESFPVDSARPRRTGPMRILHAGELYVGRDPRPLLDAVRTLAADKTPEFRVEFLGRVEYSPGADLMSDARQRGVEPWIAVRGQVSYEQTLREMCAADILLLMDTPGRVMGVPAKLFEYLGAARPILAMGEPDGDLAIILQASGVPYRIAPPNDVAAIREALISLLQMIVREPRNAVVSAARLRFSRNRIAEHLAAMLTNTTVQYEGKRQ